MINGLYITDFAIVRHLELSLEPGLTVLTGETGAGKSILIDALALALGARADTDSIRHGCERTEISISFALQNDSDALEWLQNNDLDTETDCVVRRLVFRDKPSKGFINGRPTPIQMLRELGDLLVDIHGQHEHQSLLRREAQRQILDDSAEIQEMIKTLSALYQKIKELEARLENLSSESSNRLARQEMLRFQVKELDDAELQSGEFSKLEEEQVRLAHASELIDGIQQSVLAIYDDEENALTDILTQTISRLESLNEYESKLLDATSLLSEAKIQVDETASLLRHLLDGIDLDPQRLNWVNQRLGTLLDLSRKHGIKADELPDTLERLRTELDDIENADSNLEKLQDQIDQLTHEYNQIAKTTSKRRQKAAKALSERTTEQMQALNMQGGSFTVSVVSDPDQRITRYGYDQIEFQVTANPGQPLRPLNKVASGGELSRISLALQVVTASTGRIPTLIFDEVDVGIGGATAEVVGGKLRVLGERRQILCVTHLAQVAAQANQQLQVIKQNDAQAQVNIQTLKQDDRINEIARMLGGVQITEQSLAHAEEMLERTI
ncbi:DNA repair protein RecN [Pseudomonadota bacterium]